MTALPGGEALSLDLTCGFYCRCNYTMELLESFQGVKECMEAMASYNKNMSEVNIGSKSVATANLKKHKLPFKIV